MAARIQLESSPCETHDGQSVPETGVSCTALAIVTSVLHTHLSSEVNVKSIFMSAVPRHSLHHLNLNVKVKVKLSRSLIN